MLTENDTRLKLLIVKDLGKFTVIVFSIIMGSCSGGLDYAADESADNCHLEVKDTY